MDQLKIVLEHRFWILSALAVLIAPISWWVSTGDMATEADKRVNIIKGKIKVIDELKKNAKTNPNNEWIEGGKQVNGRLADRVDQTQKRLFDHQRSAMVFHPLVKKEYDAAKVKYRGDNPGNPKAFQDMKRLFISRYVDMWRSEVLDVVQPFDVVTADQGKVLCTGENGSIQITRAPVEVWQQRQMIPTDEMWAAQEDVWFLHALMQAVARVNEGSSSIDDSQIKRLISAELRGGSDADLADRRKKKQSPASPAAGGQPGGGGLGMSGLGARSEAAEQGPRPLPMIDPDDIFGAADEGGAASGSIGVGRKGGPVERAPANPYIATSGGKWRARGFVLRVVMDHQAIPKLLTALTEAPFPVVIKQVEHIQPYDFQKGRQQQPVISTDNESEQKRIKANEERLNLAMNQSNLAEVLVAGGFIFYDEPSTATAEPTAPSASSAPVKAAPAAKTASGTPAPAAGAKAAGAAAPAPAPKNAAPNKAPSASGGTPSTPASPKSTAPAAPPATSPSAPKPGQPVKP
ncbi:MAG TPA: hypothetical protein VEI07_09205 [Planctomycetaceae bacterium]|nr:hypothetical protein [Planctomycetaceae bacterium]